MPWVQTDLQAHVVVEVGIGLALILIRGQVWLQGVRSQQLGKQVAAGKVLKAAEGKGIEKVWEQAARAACG